MSNPAVILTSTITQYERQVDDNVARKRAYIALLKAKNRITFNESGKNVEWKARFDRNGLTVMDDESTPSFERRNRHKVATLEWGGYMMNESLTVMDQLKNRGSEAIIDLFANTMEWMGDDFEDNFHRELYIDGNASGNEGKIQGLESFFGVTTTTGASNKTRDPSDTYAGLSTVLGNYGGTWGSDDWPDGGVDGTPPFDFWSPLPVNSSHATAFGSGATFTTKGDEMLRFGLIKIRRNENEFGDIRMVSMNDSLWNDFLNLIDDKERITVQRGQQASPMVALGFSAINFDGVDCLTEFGVPASTVYGVNPMAQRLRSMHGTLFHMPKPKESQDFLKTLWHARFAGQMQSNPRGALKIYPYG